MAWAPETYLVAHLTGPFPVAGYTYRGLGLHTFMRRSSKNGKIQKWTLTHLGTGHSLATLKGDVRTVFPVAGEIAEAGDWDFSSFAGYKDIFPEAPEKMRQWAASHKSVVVDCAADSDENRSSPEIARQIAMDRA